MPHTLPRHPLLALFSVTVGAGATAAGALVLLAWPLGLSLLQPLLPWLGAMKVNTALSVVLLGLALCLMRGGAAAQRAGKVAVVIAAAVGIVTLIEYLLGRNLGIDQLLYTDGKTLAGEFPGRPSAATALAATLLSVDLFFADRRAHRSVFSGVALAATLIVWVALNGYLFGVRPLQGIAPYSVMSLPSAVLLLLLGLGVMAMEPLGWPARSIMSGDMGGLVSRWLLPTAFLAPPLLGWLFDRLRASGLIELEFSWSLYAVSSSLGSAGLILLLARHR